MTVKEAVHELLSGNRNIYFSGEELSASLNVSRAAVWKAVKALQAEGYPIEAVTGKGYKMLSHEGALTEDSLLYALPSNLRKNNILVYDVIDSTNLKAKELALKGAEHGSVILANQQTAGRGRLGRSFYSPQDGLYLSIIIKPDFDLSRSVLVTSAAACAVCQSISEVVDSSLKDQVKIKWVNDIYIGKKKVCGILTEAMTDFESGQIDRLIIGIGVNTSLEGFPTELLEVAGAVEGDYSKSQLAASIIAKTLEYVSQISFDSKEVPFFMEIYKERSLLTGKTIKVYKGAYRSDPTVELGGKTAKVLGIAHEGGLNVIYTDGTRETLTSGEVSVRL